MSKWQIPLPQIKLHLWLIQEKQVGGKQDNDPFLGDADTYTSRSSLKQKKVLERRNKNIRLLTNGDRAPMEGDTSYVHKTLTCV